MCCITACPDDWNYYFETGKCVKCAAYEVPNETEDGCVPAPVCVNNRDYMEEMGDCKTCPEYTYPNLNKTACDSDTCDEEVSWLKKDGTCEKCEEGYKATIDENGNNVCYKVVIIGECKIGWTLGYFGARPYCYKDRECPSQRFIQEDGYCSNCEANEGKHYLGQGRCVSCNRT